MMGDNGYRSAYGVSAYNKKDYDKVRGVHYRALHKPKALEYQRNYRKTWDGWLSLTYSHMRTASKLRKHPMPTFTKEQLWWWMYDNCRNRFIRLHSRWLDSGCIKWLKPSIDRLNNDQGYSLDNIRLVTWKENAVAGRAYLKELRRRKGYNVS